MGATRSITVTTDVQVLVLPMLLVTVRVTILFPTFEQSKLLMLIDLVTGPQRSEEPLSTTDGVMVTCPVASNCTVAFLQRAVGLSVFGRTLK